jgi:cytidyltransferase-like protein
VGKVFVTGHFDDLRRRDVRFLEEAYYLGEVHVLLWGDEGSTNKFPVKERLYFLESLRYVAEVTVVEKPKNEDELSGKLEGCWAVRESQHSPAKRQFCEKVGMTYEVFSDAELEGVRIGGIGSKYTTKRKRVLVTGCYDWLHTGHVRFFEEVSEYGDLFVVVGHDANIALLKGAGHPHFKEEERRYMVQAIRFVSHALISSGNGWLDAEPEIERIRPDIYAVNEDGDKPEKKEYCREHGIEYLVLKRLPKAGLPRRESTVLRGF